MGDSLSFEKDDDFVPFPLSWDGSKLKNLKELNLLLWRPCDVLSLHLCWEYFGK